MKVLNYNIQDLYLTNRKLFGKLKRTCYKNGFIRYIFRYCSDRLNEYYAHILFDENDKILSWAMSYNITPSNKFIMLWTPYKNRRKGFIRIVLNQLRQDYNFTKVSAYEEAEKVISKVYNDSHNKFYPSILLPHRITE